MGENVPVPFLRSALLLLLLLLGIPGTALAQQPSRFEAEVEAIRLLEIRDQSIVHVASLRVLGEDAESEPRRLELIFENPLEIGPGEERRQRRLRVGEQALFRLRELSPATGEALASYRFAGAPGSGDHEVLRPGAGALPEPQSYQRPARAPGYDPAARARLFLTIDLLLGALVFITALVASYRLYHRSAPAPGALDQAANEAEAGS